MWKQHHASYLTRCLQNWPTMMGLKKYFHFKNWKLSGTQPLKKGMIG
jgi:hypothetical protein